MIVAEAARLRGRAEVDLWQLEAAEKLSRAVT
jgi:hypothetical protein